jgi:hypothetical protein
MSKLSSEAQNNKIAISDIPVYNHGEKKIKKLFSSDKCIKANVDNDFHKYFEGSGSTFGSTFGLNYIINKFDSGNEIYYLLENLHLYYFIGFDVHHNYMIIASRLDSYDNSYTSGQIVAEAAHEGGGPSVEENSLLDRVMSFMEELNIGPENLSENFSFEPIQENELHKVFRDAAEEALIKNRKVVPYISYTKYDLSKKSEITKQYKDIFEINKIDGSFNCYLFKATFKGVYIPNQESYFYFEKTINSKTSQVKNVKSTTEDVYAGNPINEEEPLAAAPVSEPPRPADDREASSEDVPGEGMVAPAASGEGVSGERMEASAVREGFPDNEGRTPSAFDGGFIDEGNRGVRGGINRKLKRKELNTMTLNELKQLHRNNGIKMNSNKTVNALINNYIKNYK